MDPNSRLIVRGGTFVDFPGGHPRVRAGGSLTIEDGRIAGYDASPGELPADAAATAIDGHGRAILPGLVNCHGHGYSTFARGMALAGAAPENFGQILERLWWRIDKALELEDIGASLLPVLAEAIRCGTTVVFDHHASPNAVRGSLAAIAAAFNAAGLRGDLCYETSDRDGPEVATAGLEENAAFLSEVAVCGAGRLAGHFGLHAAFTLSDETLERAVELAGRTGAGFHIHVAEDRLDQERSLAEHGRRVLERLDDLGVLGPATIAAHCVHVDEREIELLAASGTFVAHNPHSNLGNAVGIADLPALLAAGVRVGLGTDGCSMRMQNGMALAAGLQKVRRGDPRVFGAGELIRIAFAEPHRLVSEAFGVPYGTFEPGSAGDLAVFDYRPPTEMLDKNFEGHLAFGLVDAPVALTVCDGRVLYGEGRVASFDAEAAAGAARERASRLWRRLGVNP